MRPRDYFVVTLQRPANVDGLSQLQTTLGAIGTGLRDTTERPETVAVGTNELIGTDPERMGPVLDTLFAGAWKRGGIPEKWDGQAGERNRGGAGAMVGPVDRLMPGILTYYHTLRHLRIIRPRRPGSVGSV